MSEINAFFDKVYLINLDSRTDRLENFKLEAEKLGLKYQRRTATDGKTCGSQPVDPPMPGWTKISLGNYGNVLSQRFALLDSIKIGYESTLILEDDVQFAEKSKIDEFLSLVPKNWDMIYFGGNHQEPIIPIDKKVARCQFTLTAHSVGIRKSVYAQLLKLTEGAWAPIDLYYAMLHKSLNVYTSIEPLSWQIPGYSDINDSYTDYKMLRG